jgi:pimeloyl-ACP methyl ester carboxylesterase
MRESDETGHVLCLGSCGFHRMHYYAWGDAANPRVLVCVHGLTRTARDFDFLAAALSRDFRVICPDVTGRGKSDWLEAGGDYGYVQYMADMTALFARVIASGGKEIHWLGTSMGGLLGILIASQPRNPIRKLVVNDAGMLVPKAALERLALYVGKDPRFASLEALEGHVRRVSAPFGALADAQWRHLTLHIAKQHTDGTWGYSYDPAIARPFEGALDDIDLSSHWDAVSCPTLLLRGAESDLLLSDTARDMTQRGPKARLVEFAGIGHAPMLMCEEQVRVVREFLLETVS